MTDDPKRHRAGPTGTWHSRRLGAHYASRMARRSTCGSAMPSSRSFAAMPSKYSRLVPRMALAVAITERQRQIVAGVEVHRRDAFAPATSFVAGLRRNDNFSFDTQGPRANVLMLYGS